MGPRALATFATTAAAVVFAGLGCSGDGSGARMDGLEGGTFLTCAQEMRAVPYAPGMQVMSTSGALVVKLLDSEPGPPFVKGNNDWTIEVDDATTAAPVDGATFGVMPFMIDHNHGTTVPAVVTPSGTPGQYTIAPLYLYMAGYWQIRLTITPPATGDADASAPPDKAVFHICVPD